MKKKNNSTYCEHCAKPSAKEVNPSEISRGLWFCGSNCRETYWLVRFIHEVFKPT